VRTVENDFQFPVIVNRVRKRILNLNFISTLGRREIIIPHRDSHVADDFGSDILPSHGRPWLDREAMVFGVIAIATDEVRKSPIKIKPELFFSRERRLKQYPAL